MSTEFAEMGVRFLYPEGWTLEREKRHPECRSVTVSSPATAFWTLSVHPRAADPAELVEAAALAMREEYKELESEEVSEEIVGYSLIGRNLSFYYLDLTNTAWIRCVRTDRATYTVFCQAEDHEFDQLEDVFRAMMVSFLSNVAPAL
ncbi:MAG: hypothetical protein GX621_17775 [Pirellulaceae bacterium]|nr:hypothetical protein [Pirellulaceae bacterium]